MNVTIKRVNAVAVWKWDMKDDCCGICRMAFETCCPDCKVAGDECPPGEFRAKERPVLTDSALHSFSVDTGHWTPHITV